MVINQPKAAPATTFAFSRFVQADIKGGAAAATYRNEQIRIAIEQGYKGNYSPITEAAALSTGQAKKARAYAAGFQSLANTVPQPEHAHVGPIAKIAYVGALSTAENAPVRAAIDHATTHAMQAFTLAFDAVMATKAAPKPAKAPAVAPTEPEAADTDNGTVNAGIMAKALNEHKSDAVADMIAMIVGGVLTDDQLAAIVDAVQQVADIAVQPDDAAALLVAMEAAANKPARKSRAKAAH